MIQITSTTLQRMQLSSLSLYIINVFHLKLNTIVLLTLDLNLYFQVFSNNQNTESVAKKSKSFHLLALNKTRVLSFYLSLN